jgi:hypothetical protein
LASFRASLPSAPLTRLLFALRIFPTTAQLLANLDGLQRCRPALIKALHTPFHALCVGNFHAAFGHETLWEYSVIWRTNRHLFRGGVNSPFMRLTSFPKNLTIRTVLQVITNFSSIDSHLRGEILMGSFGIIQHRLQAALLSFGRCRIGAGCHRGLGGQNASALSEL